MVDTAMLLEYWKIIKDPAIFAGIILFLVYSYDWFRKRKPKKSPEEERKMKYEQCKKHYGEYIRLWNEINSNTFPPPKGGGFSGN